MDKLHTYFRYLKEACETIKLDYFPQMQASDLLYKVITIQDLYLPVRLKPALIDFSRYDVNYDGIASRYTPDNPANNEIDIDELIRKIDARIAELEAESKQDNTESFEENEPMFINSGEKECAESDWDTIIHEVSSEERVISNRNDLIIQALPGSGKTTFCKRLILALVDCEKDFIDSINKITSVKLVEDAIPLFLTFRNMENLKELVNENASAERILYCFTCNILGERFARECSYVEFLKTILSRNDKPLYLIVDGWDELFDYELQQKLEEKLAEFTQENNNASIIFTIRSQYTIPAFLSKNVYTIDELNEEDIVEYCKKYYSIIYRDNNEKRLAYHLVAENIIKMRKANDQIMRMSQIPLSLSQLLTLSRYDGCLPENKSKLYSDLLDLYIGWATNKAESQMTQRTMHTLLAYIATYMTKHNKFLCNIEELQKTIKNCISDLSGSFSEIITEDDIPKIIAELEHSAILGKQMGEAFGFVMHRTMQEYLTAYAIVTQNADAEYNDMLPLEIFQDKYKLKRWREVIVYAVLMNDGRLRQSLVSDLIKKAKDEEDNYAYTNLLFEFIINAAPIRLESRHKIFDLLFENHITDTQIDRIHDLMTYENETARDFKEYIVSKFSGSVTNNSSEYGYAMAAIKAAEILLESKSPLVEAEKLIITGTDFEVMLGFQILTIMGWCKYANINNVYHSYIRDYKFSEELLRRVKIIISDRYYIDDIAKSIKDCILADFTTFEEVIDEKMYNFLLTELNDVTTSNVYSEILLSLGPVRERGFAINAVINAETKKKYMERLKKEIDDKAYDEIIFTYTICSIFDRDIADSNGKTWQVIKQCYDTLKSDYYFGRTRYRQIVRSSWANINFEELLMSHSLLAESEPSVPTKLSAIDKRIIDIKNVALKQGFATKEFSFETERYISKYKEDNLTEDGKPFMEGIHTDPISTKNNISYLYRRQEITEVIRLDENNSVNVSPRDLLQEGVKEHEPFSVINNALTYVFIQNSIIPEGIQKGLYVLDESLDENHRSFGFLWNNVKSWWTSILMNRNETEGLIVLYWLIKTEILDVDNIEPLTKKKMIEVYKDRNELLNDEGLTRMINMLEKQMQLDAIRMNQES